LTARAAYAALYWSAFSPAPWTVLYLWQPGYMPVAGLAGGALYVLYRLRRQSAAGRLSGLRVVSTAAAVGATLLAVVLGTMNLASHAGVLKAGDTVPDFQLVDLDGEPVSYSDLEGKGVVLNFWATWCPPCRREMPLLESAWGRYGSENVVIVGIDVGESLEDVRRFVDAQGFSYPIWVEPESDAGAADTNEMLGWFGSAGLPTTVFVRSDGVIDKVYIGELNRALLLERIPRLLPGSD
jgi:peroxiredoxin